MTQVTLLLVKYSSRSSFLHNAIPLTQSLTTIDNQQCVDSVFKLLVETSSHFDKFPFRPLCPAPFGPCAPLRVSEGRLLTAHHGTPPAGAGGRHPPFATRLILGDSEFIQQTVVAMTKISNG